MPVANPDGYDFTFEPGHRLWRKNLRDNDGDGVITAGDGVDLNRNFPTKWGYDNEGSSPSFGSETYRGTGPASEPETQALDGLLDRVGFEFLINYHSAAELLLYGIGWQVATPDARRRRLRGDGRRRRHSRRARLRPRHLGRALHHQRRDRPSTPSAAYGTLGVHARDVDVRDGQRGRPRRRVGARPTARASSASPTTRRWSQAEFEKNIPFALATAQSALDPDDPVSVVGRTAPDFVVDSFDVSYGDPQTVAVTARRVRRSSGS